jgi:ABC-type hemin transport system ATPase subunit
MLMSNGVIVSEGVPEDVFRSGELELAYGAKLEVLHSKAGHLVVVPT